MKALVKVSPSAGFTMQEIEIPSIHDNDVLIRIKKTAICGTDLHIFSWDEWAKKYYFSSNYWP